MLACFVGAGNVVLMLAGSAVPGAIVRLADVCFSAERKTNNKTLKVDCKKSYNNCILLYAEQQTVKGTLNGNRRGLFATQLIAYTMQLS